MGKQKMREIRAGLAARYFKKRHKIEIRIPQEITKKPVGPKETCLVLQFVYI